MKREGWMLLLPLFLPDTWNTGVLAGAEAATLDYEASSQNIRAAKQEDPQTVPHCKRLLTSSEYPFCEDNKCLSWLNYSYTGFLLCCQS